MGKYNVGEVWWIHFPYGDKDVEKRRPAINTCRFMMKDGSVGCFHM